MNKWVAICTGKDCRKHKKAINRLRSDLLGKHEVHLVRCLKICKKGPIVVAQPGNGEKLFQKIKGKEIRAAFLDYMSKGVLSSALEKRWRKKKSKYSIKPRRIQK